ncbi:ABC transporter permease [Shewanella sedimentimangrovi]|uniref:ABC transporter permease subunit n=1 Tax=Shewanella sedimentimangrovi TaxID=2814293 RepID=A0ABX7R318_9GAMM|nr:ABC transporter permease subunit [Shewanella sedimentimangrovi]QSX37687.1 ABC transporter permease subunit [Shewanella sedimentimangrovi]
MTQSPVLAVAIKEFQDGLRNRWLLSITLIFAVLSLGLSYYGAAASGTVGTLSLSSTIASLASLAVFLIPLIALLLAYDSFVGEQESGTLLLLLTYPLSHNQLLLGKFIGQGAIISLATALGFGSSALLLALQTQVEGLLPAFGLFILTAALLGLCFIALAYVISLSVSEKSKAAGLALSLWFAFVLVFDLALLALLVGVKDGLDQQWLIQIMLLNPADLFRLINMAALDTSDVNGVLAVAINSSWSVPSLLALMLAWVLVPLGLAALIFNRKSL